MLRSICGMFAIALVAGAMWSCGGDRVTQSQVAEEQVGRPLSKVAAAGHSLVVVATVHEAETPVSGVTVEFSRSVAGQSASYDWSGMTDDAGQARVTITGGSGYYQARAVRDGGAMGSWSSIPLNAGAEVMLDLPLGGRAQVMGSSEVTPPSTDPRELTRAYVEAGIARYERDGREATLAYYNSPESIEGERDMMIVRVSDWTILATAVYPTLVGNNTVAGPGTPLGTLLLLVTAEGFWAESIRNNPVTGQQEPALAFAILHDGLAFVSAHAIVREDLADVTVDYVQRAIELYDREGLEATVAYYDSRASVDGQFYLFLIDENDIYLAHPIFPHLKGTDIKDVVGSDGQVLGEEIAEATEEGHWVDYLWPNPETGLEEPKSAWVIRHDGLIFASGYYTPDPNAEPPAWKDAEPREYTVTYVENAIARYERDGLEAMKHYYSSVASFEGQWYMFIMDANDIYIVHGLLSHLIGTDIKDVVGSDGYELGKEIAKATEEGHWVNYLWPHPWTLQEVPKAAYVVRHDGLIFASGYYPEEEDPRSKTQAYVADAIAYYNENGLDATLAYYNSEASIDGQWYLLLFDENNLFLVNPLFPNLIGLDIKITGLPVEEITMATEEGFWVKYPLDNPLSPEKEEKHAWVVRHDGLIFLSGYLSSE